MIPIPITLMDEINKGECIIIAGAGLSTSAGMPTLKDLKEALGNEILDNIDECIPRESESFYDVARDYEMLFNRANLCQMIAKCFISAQKQASVSEGHRLVVKNFKTIVTTNWDNLFENAAEQLGIPYSVATRDEDIAFITREKTRIIKMHGSITYLNTLVITALDHDNFDIMHPGITAFLKSIFSSHTILFIGFSLQDEQFRRILNIINLYLGGLSRKAYAIDPKVDRIKEMDLADRGIIVIRSTATDFLEALFEKPSELRINDSSNPSIDALLKIRNNIDDQISKQYEKEVTIMFTDMVGSTTFFASRGDIAGRALLQRHNDILFPVVRGGDGEIVKMLGDGLLCSFLTADDAVWSAVKIQKSLANYNNNSRTGEDIHIRIGINTGSAIVEKGDYLGATVSLAARVQGVAEPNRIIISEKTHQNLNTNLQKICTELGEITLKGFAKPHKLYIVNWENL